MTVKEKLNEYLEQGHVIIIPYKGDKFICNNSESLKKAFSIINNPIYIMSNFELEQEQLTLELGV